MLSFAVEASVAAAPFLSSERSSKALSAISSVASMRSSTFLLFIGKERSEMNEGVSLTRKSSTTGMFDRGDEFAQQLEEAMD